MYDDWPETTKVLSTQLRNLRGGAPDVMKAFSAIAQTALAPKALDAKTKELIALGMVSRFAATIASPFTSRRHWTAVPHARKLVRRWVWQSIWERVRQ
jgi:hypothetical protein